MNRLRHETSPYLLQHAGNPVNWYAWKPEALARARVENKPILVSIGYSTCHWCHVMEHESFENEDIAAFMNDNFVCIKVDREERPDVDAIYMEACQILNGSGGWPLNCFLTPDCRPFYAGTYFPPRPAHNRPSWLQVLQHMSRVWESEREKVYEQAERLTARIRGNDEVFVQGMGPESAGEAPFPADLPDTIFARMRDSFDRAEGGFGGAPKFPSTMAIQYLLNYHWFTRQPEALEHALLSLDKMIQGGIYDQIGGGFARYSTDREWLAPHFEKMLYDNALLVGVLAEAYKLTKKDLYRETIEETLEYIRRDMTHPEGGFYSAEDADSEGEEGKFYVWDKAEIDQLLGEEAALFCDFYDISESGNWEHVNILRRLRSYEAYASANDLDLADLKQRLRAGRERLFVRRAERVRPGLDDKILLGWNALMASAYAAAFTALGREEYRQAALRNLDFCLEKFAQPGGEGLFHTWKNAQAQYDAFLDDYAFLADAGVVGA
ncbi:MAG TPA: thioredoxin domain-containing protein, partial [Saprospiraceae bacterium]|nr:thioredoxin domain-containing protein [Saprospiraceae bacterium]